MRIRFIGTGDAIPTMERQNTSLLLRFDERVVLVDCSGTPIQSLLRAECNLDTLSDVILTHAHVDHIYALPSLMHALWLRRYPQQADPIRVHGLQETLRVAGELIDVFDLRTKPAALPVEMTPVDPDSREILDIQCGAWTINAFRVRHGKTPALGLYVTKANQTKVVFSADAVADDCVKSRITPDTYTLIHDCGGGVKGNQGHAGAVEINALVRGTGIKQLFLTHLPYSLSRDEERTILDVVSVGFSGDARIPQDGDEIIIDQPDGSGLRHPPSHRWKPRWRK